MTNRYHYIIGIYFLITASCYPMQQSKKAFTTLSLTTAKAPYQIKFLTDNNLIINYGREYVVFDTIEQKKIISINNYHIADLTVHHNRTQFAIIKPQLCTIYDATNYAKLWEIDKLEDNITASFFSSVDNSIIIEYDYSQPIQYFPTKQASYLSEADTERALHPKKLEWCIINLLGEVMIDSTHQPLHKILNLDINGGVLTPKSCQYSADGNIIAIEYLHKMYIIKPSDNTNSAHYSFKRIIPTGRRIFKTIMHPNSSVIFTILSADNTLQNIEYWDMHTTDCIYKTPNTDFPFNAELACHYEAYTIFSQWQTITYNHQR